MTKKSDAPAIRFKGFSDAWEQRKLSEITDKVTEKNAGLQYVETFTNSAEFGIISQRDFFDHDIAKLGSLDGYYIVKTEDFVYNPRISTSAPVGPINRNKLGRTGVMSPLYTVFRPHDIDTTYLEYFFKCGYWHSFMNFNGDSGARSDRFSIRDNVFFQMPIPIPDIDEQRKIGELLTCLDNLITLHQRKFEKLTNVKKSMLEKMFPQNGSSYPEIRFKGFTDPWEQRKLGDVVQITMGQSPDGSTYSDEPSDYILVQGNADLQNGWVCPRIWTTQITKKADAGDLIMSVRAPAGAMGKTAYNAVIGRGVAAIKGNEFIYQLLVKMDADGFWKTLSCGSTFESLNSDNIKNAEVKIPTTAEQIKIGGYFQQLDNLITLHQRQPFLQSPPDISLIVQLTPPFYTFSWEQRKLASLCEKFTDGDWIESKDQSDFGVRLVQTGNVGVAEYLDKTNNKKWISEDTFDRLHCEEVLPGDILISRLPEPAGRACIVPLLGTKMITAVDCTIVRTAPDMSNKFLVQYLSSQAYFDDVNTCLAGGTRQRISRGNLANFNVPIPVKKSEQDAIGMFFGYLDNLITLHQRQTIVYAVIRSIRKVILAERQYFAPPMVRKSP